MKTASVERQAPANPAQNSDFKQVLQRTARPRPVPAGKANPLGRTAVPPPLPMAKGPAPVEKLVTARQAMHAEATRLTDTRREGVGEQHQKLDERLIDVICQELLQEFEGEAKTRAAYYAQAHRPLPAGAAPTPFDGALDSARAERGARAERSERGAADPAARAAAAVELVERIDFFVRSHRPALAMTLAGGAGAQVEIERIGPKEVAVRVHGKRGPPPPEELTRIREEIRSRGLKLSVLSVA